MRLDERFGLNHAREVTIPRILVDASPTAVKNLHCSWRELVRFFKSNKLHTWLVLVFHPSPATGDLLLVAAFAARYMLLAVTVACNSDAIELNLLLSRRRDWKTVQRVRRRIRQVPVINLLLSHVILPRIAKIWVSRQLQKNFLAMEHAQNRRHLHHRD